jgi:hypothetical protein
MYVATASKPSFSKLALSAAMLTMLLPPTLTPRSSATKGIADFIVDRP